MKSDNLVRVLIDDCVKETEKAILVLIEGEEVWLPKSQMVPGFGADLDCGSCKIFISEWIAREKGLI